MTTQSTILKDATPANTITLDNTDGVFSVKKGEPGVAIASFASTGNAVKGTTTNDNAAAGMVGEYVSSYVVLGSKVTLATSIVTYNLTSISLTAGDWDLSYSIWYDYNSGTVTTLEGGISTASATLPTRGNGQSSFWFGSAVGAVPSLTGAGIRLSLASPTTVYCVVASAWSGGTTNFAYGGISARRVR